PPRDGGTALSARFRHLTSAPCVYLRLQHYLVALAGGTNDDHAPQIDHISDMYRRRGRMGYQSHVFWHQGSTLSSVGSSRSEIELSESGSSLSSGSGSDMDLAALRDPARLTLDLLVDPHEMCPLLDVYEPLIGWFDSDLRLFNVCEHSTNNSINSSVNNNSTTNGCGEKLKDFNSRSKLRSSARCSEPQSDKASQQRNTLDNTHRKVKPQSTHEACSAEGCQKELPCLAVVLFLFEEEIQTGGRVDRARRQFERSPWRLHHCEKTQRRNLNLNRHALDYFFISEDLPLWAVRQVHYGREHIRVVVHTKEDTWSDMVQFYKLILGFEPEVLTDDFCLFTVYSQINFDIQFALKRTDSSASSSAFQPAPMQSARLKFKVAELGRLVPLFPNVCQPVSDSCWLTTDHDGNEVVLDVIGHYAGSSSSGASSGSERASSESCTSASSSDVSFDSHDSGLSHGSVFSADTREHPPRSTLDTFKRRKSRGAIKEPGDNKKGQRRVTFCFDDVPPRHSASSPPPCLPPPPVYPSDDQGSSKYRADSPSPLESRFSLRFDTCPTAPLLGNKRREEQIGFYV
ncbi:hypothetical protein BaRGS_00024003, partial [Batillaria attramentaria]